MTISKSIQEGVGRAVIDLSWPTACGRGDRGEEHQEIQRLSLQHAFERIQLAINLACFPLGVTIFVAVAWPVLRAMAMLREGVEPPAASLGPVRRRALRIGRYGALVCVGLWLAASIVYPICLMLAVPGMPSDLKQRLIYHFLASLILCGLVAAGYPFFFGSALATGVFYPMLLRPGVDSTADRAELRKLDRALWPNLLLVAAVPLGGVLLLIPAETTNKSVIAGLCVAGLIGGGLAVMLLKRVQQDLAALRPLVGSASAPVTTDDTYSGPSWRG